MAAASYQGMKMLRRAVSTGAAVLVVVAIGAGCGGNSKAAAPSPDTFIKMAMTSSTGKAWGVSRLFPTKPGTVKCVIRGGGPPPGIRVPGTCSTTIVHPTRVSATVRFVETWNAHRFRGPGAHGRQHLSHTYELKISTRALGDKVVRSRDYGDFPPQRVR